MSSFSFIEKNMELSHTYLAVHELHLVSQKAFYQRFWLLTTSIVSCGTGNKPSSVGGWYPNCWPIQLQKALPFTIAKSPKPETRKKLCDVTQLHMFFLFTKGHSTLFDYFIDMRTTVNLSISCKKTCFCWKISTKTCFFYKKWTD